jgi:hypothetical protein
MAINPTDNYNEELFTYTFTISGGDDSTTQQTSLNNFVASVKSKLTLTVNCSSLDAPVTLEQYEGNLDDITKMGPILDASTQTAIADTLEGSNNYVIYSEYKSFFVGLKLIVGSATTGTVTITGRA